MKMKVIFNSDSNKSLFFCQIGARYDGVISPALFTKEILWDSIYSTYLREKATLRTGKRRPSCVQLGDLVR